MKVEKNMLFTTSLSSPLGPLMLAGDGENISGLWLAGQRYCTAATADNFVEKNNLPVFEAAKSWLQRYFAGEKPAISALPLAPQGSEFRRAVWALLRQIPYGQVTTYGKIAKMIAAQMNKKNMSPQAIGGAVGHNPISIIIPCHRVVGANGNLTGYAGGIDLKVWLLKHEGVDRSRLFIPAGEAVNPLTDTC